MYVLLNITSHIHVYTCMWFLMVIQTRQSFHSSIFQGVPELLPHSGSLHRFTHCMTVRLRTSLYSLLLLPLSPRGLLPSLASRNLAGQQTCPIHEVNQLIPRCSLTSILAPAAPPPRHTLASTTALCQGSSFTSCLHSQTQ